MGKSRGRPKKPLPVHPNRVISTAVQRGLSATVVLQKALKNSNTEHIYRSSHEIWIIAKDVYLQTKRGQDADFSFITKAEAQLRDNMWKMLVEKATEYGCTEITRVKSSDEEVGPLNQRFNVGGAALRNFVMKMYPFPDPVSFGKRTRRVGTGRKQFRVAGYERSVYGPEVQLVHVDLPALDFGDAVRSHIEYLETYCYMYDVPILDTTRYCNLYLMLVRPYLDYIYSEHRYGRPGFRNGLNTSLHMLKEAIQKHYRIRERESTVTDSITHTKPSFSTDFFREQVKQVRDSGIDHPMFDELERIVDGGYFVNEGVELPCLTEKDVEHIWKQSVKRSGRIGSQIHRRISTLFPNPWSLSRSLFEHHDFDDSTHYRLVSEVPLLTDRGSGKADLILLQRTAIDNGKRVIWKPVFVLDIKTKLGLWFTMGQVEKESESRSHSNTDLRTVAEFPLQNRKLTTEEWTALIEATPTSSTEEQITTYARAIMETYQQTTGDDSSEILKGTLLIDATEEYPNIQKRILPLVIKAYENLRYKIQNQTRTRFTSDRDEHIAIISHIMDTPLSNNEPLPIPWKPAYDPFEESPQQNRRFILYLSTRNPGSSGESAAWISRYYHGLQMIHELKHEKPDSKIIWLDLANEFSQSMLAETRLRLRPFSYSENNVLKSHPDSIREFFEGITVKGVLDDITDTVMNEAMRLVLPDIATDKDKNLVVIVSGWDTINNSIPRPHRGRLNVVLQEILNQLPHGKNTTVVWFDSPVPAQSNSIPYSSRTLIPFYSNSPLTHELTQIVWNLPVAPRSAIIPKSWGFPNQSSNPMHDDIRTIIFQTRNELSSTLILVPPLNGWARRFRNGGLGLLHKEQKFEDLVPDVSTRQRIKLLSLTLLPWVSRLHSKSQFGNPSDGLLGPQFECISEEFLSHLEVGDVATTELSDQMKREPTILERIRLKPPEERAGRAFVSISTGMINSPRLYRSPNKVRSRFRERISESLSEKIGTRVTYGLMYGSEEDSHSWMVVPDPEDEARVLLGCFRRGQKKESEFLWSEQEMGVRNIASVDDIIQLPQTRLFFHVNQTALETWACDSESDVAEYVGTVEIIKDTTGNIGRILAFRNVESSKTRLPLPNLIEPNLLSMMQHTLRLEIKRWLAAIQCQILLESEDIICKIKIKSEDGILQEIETRILPDLISLLRWPFEKGRPLRIDSGLYVTWDVFNGIDYGNIEDIRPIVETSAVKESSQIIPVRVAEFIKQHPKVSISISHDFKQCPILAGQGEHGECWRISLPDDCTLDVKQSLEGVKSGKNLYGLIASKIVANHEIELNLPTISEQDASIVFQEDKWIRRIFRENDILLKQLPPGSYVYVDEQSWTIVLSWGKQSVQWSASSTLTNLQWEKRIHTLDLNYTSNLIENRQTILESITCEISPERIQNLKEVEAEIEKELVNLGFGSNLPRCEIEFAFLDWNRFQFSVIPEGMSKQNRILERTVIIEPNASTEGELEQLAMAFDEGDLSGFNFINETEFMEEVTKFLENLDSH